MTTENLPPVVTAGGPPTATGGTILVVPAEAAVFDQEFLDNYDLDVEGGDEYTLSQKMVHFCGGIITQTHWIACKACLAFFAGAATSKMLTTTKALKEAACLQVYFGAIDALDNTCFNLESKVFFRHSLQKKDEPMTALALYRYYQDTRSKVRNQVLPFFPKDLVSMKSGRGFHESCNEVYINAYRNGLTKKQYTKEEADRMLPPPLWEYTRAPWYFGLLVKIFRRDPQLALQVADVMTDKTNMPISRAEIKRQKQVGIAAAGVASTSIVPTATARAAAASSDSSSAGGISCVEVVPSVQQKQLLWAKVTASKALKENTNIAKRMGKMEELEKGMTLLEKMRQAIGPSFENEYKARVRTLYAAMPDFTTFDTAVDVIDVDAEDAIVPTPKTKKRSFEVQEVEIKQEVDSPYSVATTESEFERGTQWLRDLHPSPFIHAPPDSDEEHISVTDDDGNLVAVRVQSKKARLAAEAGGKLKKK
jgi:hypothetical protein